MAPEVARGCLYNQACDVYSFAIIFWQMLSLKLPYESRALDLTYLVEKVWGGPKLRPDLDPRWDESLQTLIFEAWSPTIKWRPSMNEIEEILKSHVHSFDDAFLLREHQPVHASRRSAHFMEAITEADTAENP